MKVIHMKTAALFLTGLLLAGSAFAAVSYAATPLEIISARQANQKRVGDIAKSVKTALGGQATAASQLEIVKELDQRAHLLKGYFPAGTEAGGDTKALPAIWSDRAGFDKAADTYTDAVDKLLALAQAGDTAGFTTQFAAVGDTCGACHRTYRAR
jgi:cytochrome c556